METNLDSANFERTPLLSTREDALIRDTPKGHTLLIASDIALVAQKSPLTPSKQHLPEKKVNLKTYPLWGRCIPIIGWLLQHLFRKLFERRVSSIANQMNKSHSDLRDRLDVLTTRIEELENQRSQGSLKESESQQLQAFQANRHALTKPAVQAITLSGYKNLNEAINAAKKKDKAAAEMLLLKSLDDLKRLEKLDSGSENRDFIRKCRYDLHASILKVKDDYKLFRLSAGESRLLKEKSYVDYEIQKNSSQLRILQKKLNALADLSTLTNQDLLKNIEYVTGLVNRIRQEESKRESSDSEIEPFETDSLLRSRANTPSVEIEPSSLGTEEDAKEEFFTRRGSTTSSTNIPEALELDLSSETEFGGMDPSSFRPEEEVYASPEEEVYTSDVEAEPDSSSVPNAEAIQLAKEKEKKQIEAAEYLLDKAEVSQDDIDVIIAYEPKVQLSDISEPKQAELLARFEQLKAVSVKIQSMERTIETSIYQCEDIASFSAALITNKEQLTALNSQVNTLPESWRMAFSNKLIYSEDQVNDTISLVTKYNDRLSHAEIKMREALSRAENAESLEIMEKIKHDLNDSIRDLKKSLIAFPRNLHAVVDQQITSLETQYNKISRIQAEISQQLEIIKKDFSSLEARVDTFTQAASNKEMEKVSEMHPELHRELEAAAKPNSTDHPIIKKFKLEQVEILKNRIDDALDTLPKALAPELTDKINEIAKSSLSQLDIQERLGHWIAWHKQNPGYPLGMRYLSIHQLGSGTFKNVDLVFDTATKSLTSAGGLHARAIATLGDNTSKATIEKEIRVSGRLKHFGSLFLNYSTVTDPKDKEQVGLLMGVCDGDGNKLLTEIEKLPPEKRAPAKLKVMKDLLTAINTMHSLGIIHRDLKDENLFYTYDAEKQEFQIKIGDFGSCYESRADKAKKEVSGTSPGWWPPEFSVTAESTEAMDDYSVGLYLYELMIGPLPENSGGPKISRKFSTNVKTHDPLTFYSKKTASLRDQRTEIAGLEADTKRERSVSSTHSSSSEESSIELSTDEEEPDVDEEVATVERDIKEEAEIDFEETESIVPHDLAQDVLKTNRQKQNLNKWFPEPKEKNSIEYAIWRMLQPTAKERATAATALGTIESQGAQKLYIATATENSLEHALKVKNYEVAARIYLSSISSATKMSKDKSLKENSKIVLSKLQIMANAGLNKANKKEIEQWNLALIKAFIILPQEERELLKIRVNKSKVLGCYPQLIKSGTDKNDTIRFLKKMKLEKEDFNAILVHDINLYNANVDFNKKGQ